MTKERIAKLEKLEFAWDCRKTKEIADRTTNTCPRAHAAEVESASAAVTKALDVVPPPASSKKAADLPMKLPKCEFFTFSRKFS
jgi:hypothetical protein